MNVIANHGTKILGVIITLLGALDGVDPTVFGKYGTVITLIIGGVLTTLRGFQNTANAAPPAAGSTPPAPPTKQSGRAAFTLLATLFVLAAACAAIPTPQTFNQKLEVGYGTATAVLTTTDTLLKAGKLSSTVASNIESQDNNLKAALDIARTTYAANQTDGGNQLATALTALNALQNYLTGIH